MKNANNKIPVLDIFGGDKKKETPKERKDVYWGMIWNEFISLIEFHGFKQALRYDFVDNQWDRVKTEEAVVYYDDNGFVIWATSHGGKNIINGGTIYGQIEVDQDFDRDDVLAQCSNSYYSDNEVHFYKDVRTALMATINKVKESSKPIKVWRYKSNLWFLDYMETKDGKGYCCDFEQITKAKILKCPKEFQDIVRVCIQD